MQDKAIKREVEEITGGMLYRHNKEANGYYLVMCKGFLESTKEPAIVYRDIFNKIIYIQSEKEFLQNFTKNKEYKANGTFN